MAKILVADDNSNIQKMVGLALKDHGIEVVAVGNGEAAVRKISDIRPDLVLADVFMPVRNGYEVCQYVKDDSTLSHIPVILLVGAFDPLDEQEAQRVGADGVLKKPFVPPDPLISMVKSALVRAGVAHAGFTPAVAEPPAPEAATLEPPPRVPTPMPFPKIADPAPESESFVEEVSTRPPTLKIASEGQPLAFGSLLETRGAEVEDDLRATTTARGDIGAERDWRDADTEEEGEEEHDTSKSSWRRDAGGESLGSDVARSARDWRDLGVQDPGVAATPEEGWTPTREKQDLVEKAESLPTVTAAVSEASPAAPFAGDAWAAAISTGSDERTAPVVSATEATVVETLKPSTASSWFSTPPSPWEAEAQKANQLASTWDAPAAPAVTEAIAPSSESTFEARGDLVTPSAYEATSARAPDEIEVLTAGGVVISSATVETIREEASHVVENAAAEETQALVRSNDAPQSIPAEPDLNAIVAKVLAKMSPDVLETVTREILKPVIEAIVREELGAKKQ